MSQGSKVTVYSGIACPFSHRTRMALTVKGVVFETVEIDLMNPPDWFWAGPARTQMPKLVTEEVTIHGASVANEYIDERWKAPPLLPGSPAERAEAREWINWLEVKLQPAYEAPLLENDPGRYEELARSLQEVLRELEQKLQVRADCDYCSPGWYWHGQRLGMVDLTYAATLLRFAGLREFHGWEMPAEVPALSAWVQTLKAEPVVQETFEETEVLRLIGTYRDALRILAGG
jgi:glutathione S-transferase